MSPMMAKLSAWREFPGHHAEAEALWRLQNSKLERESSAESAGLRQLEFVGQYHTVECCRDLERKPLKYSAEYWPAHSVIKLPKTMGSKERKTTPKRIMNSTLPLPTQVAIDWKSQDNPQDLGRILSQKWGRISHKPITTPFPANKSYKQDLKESTVFKWLNCIQ